MYMIKYNLNNINDWYFDTSDIVKVYRNNAVRYQKIYGGRAATPKWIATYDGGVTSSAECDANSAITQNEISLTHLVAVDIGDCVTSIGYQAFYGCSGLTSVTIPDSVTSIGGNVFAQCGSLTSITIPSGVTSISNGVFYFCTSLTSIDIPDSVTSIGERAFYNCSGLTDVTIGSGVTTIGSAAFQYCSSLTSIDLPNNVTNIGETAFYDCRSLTSVTVNAVTPPTLGSGAFDGTNDCPIYVPAASVDTYKAASGWSTYASRIQAIPSPSFSGKWLATYEGGTTSSAECDSTSAITVNEINKRNLTDVVIGDCVTSIGNQAFYDCEGLTSVTIGSGVTSIGYGAFVGCNSLTSVEIPDSVTTIDYSVFFTCSGLTSVEIGSGVTSIGDQFVRGCTSLVSVTIKAKTPPTLGFAAFDLTNDCPIYVPATSVNAYKAASRWSDYASRIQAIQ